MTASRTLGALSLACAAIAGETLVARINIPIQRAAVCDSKARAVSLNHTLEDLKGTRVRLTAFEGKVLVLNYWATWCAPCKTEIPHLVELQQHYADTGLQVIGIAVDEPPEKLKPFVAEAGINYPVLRATDRVLDAFSPVTVVPTTIVIGRDRKACSTHVGAVSRESLEQQIRALL